MSSALALMSEFSFQPHEAAMSPSTWRGIARVAIGAVLTALAVISGPGCQDHQVSQMDLQDMKRTELKQRQGTLTSQEEFRILGIQARTRAEFDREVKRILAGRSKTGPVQGPAPEEGSR